MMKKILKKTFSITMIATTLFVYIISPIEVMAKEPETLGDLKNELTDLKNQKAENDKKQQGAKDQIAYRERAIAQAELDITQAQTDMATAEIKITESTEKIAELKAETEKVLRFYQQMKSKNAVIEYASGASNMTDLVMRLAAIDQITNQAQATLDNLENLIKENEQLKIDLQKKQEELSTQITQYQAKIKSLYGDLANYDKFALDINTQVKVMQEQVNMYVKLCADSPKSYLGDNERLSDCANVPYNAGWLKPLKKGVTTSPMGVRDGSFHNAIDIGGNAEGTPIYAAAAGIVSGFVSKYWCGGNMLYIDVTVGGQKYTTYYYHLLKVNVKVGDMVTQNTVIGTVGGGPSTSKKYGGYDSCTTGAHLHFGVQTGSYNAKNGIVRARVIVPPGFPNKVGYRFNSRTDYAA